jgi:hypothetical protein
MAYLCLCVDGPKVYAHAAFGPVAVLVLLCGNYHILNMCLWFGTFDHEAWSLQLFALFVYNVTLHGTMPPRLSHYVTS